MAEINTRIILRNDTAEAWEDSTLELKGGEAAVEVVNGKAKLKIATEDGQTFAEAPYIGGAEANVFQVELADDELDIEAAIDAVVGDAELAVGDIAIVKAGIANGKTSYTSYVYSEVADGEGTKLAWAAMDGNYSAQNVYFKNDITLAGDYTSVGNVKLTDNTLSAAGQSLEDVMTSIFTKELNTGLKKSNPGASITSQTKYYEIGQAASETATVSLSSDGEYTYGYSTDPAEPTEGQVVTTVKNDKTTGVVVDTSKGDSTYSVTFNGATQTSSSATFTITAPAQTAKKELTATGKVYYTQGGVPVSNLKKAYPGQRIAASQATSGASTAIRWYVPYYKGFIYGFDNKLATVDVSKLSKVTGSTAFGSNASTAPVKPTSDTATGSWMQYWLVVPKSYNWTMSAAKDSNGLTLDVATADNIKITYGTGDTAVEIEYNVYVISHDAAYNTTGISWS